MDSLTITILFIILSTVIGAFVKGRMRDKCILSFAGDLIHIELESGKVVWGVLRLESTGLELKYKESYLDKNDNHFETSFILYKNEYPNIQCIARFIDDLDDKDKKRRERFLKPIYYQKMLRKLTRKIRNFFATVRDTVVEVVNILVGRAKQNIHMGKMISGRDKYVAQMQTGMLSSLNTAFEPILEKYLGEKVVLQTAFDGNITEYHGVLKGYTSQFLEIMDVHYKLDGQDEYRNADIVVPRSVGVIRHASE